MLQGWSGTITPTLGSYLFLPGSRNYSGVNASLTNENYAVAYMVSGSITAGATGVAGVTLTAASGTPCTVSDASGQYSCTVPYGWSGTVTPSLSGYTFVPASRGYTNVTANQATQNYAANPPPVLSGTVTANGVALGNVAFSATAGGVCTPSNATGQYSCTVPQGWTGSVTPTLNGYAFSPLSRSYGAVTADQSAQDYAASPAVQLSGTVTAGGTPMTGATLTASSGGICTVSNASGQYSCTVPQGWTGSVTPSLVGYGFTPALRQYTNVAAPQTAQDFAAAYAGATTVYYIHPDHLGTPRLIADANQTTVWRWDNQEPFGNDTPNDDPGSTGNHFDFPLRFPGQYADKETSLAYNYYRDYDPGIGRYVESDPMGVLGLIVVDGQIPGMEDFAARWFSVNPVAGGTSSSVVLSLPRVESPMPDAFSFVLSLSLYAYADGNPLRLTDFLGLNPGDKWYGFNDPAFRDYVHQIKQDWGLPGNYQFTKEELANLEKAWCEEGKPRGKGGKSGKGGRSRGWRRFLGRGAFGGEFGGGEEE